MQCFTPDPWLSNFFARPIIQAKVTAQDYPKIQQLQAQGFQFVEGEIEFGFDLVNYQGKITACEAATVEDIKQLETLFGQAFPTSRFREPWFSAAENQRLYRTWIARAVRGEFDQLCLVLKTTSGQIQGGISLRLAGEQAKVGLLAVSPAFQRQGVASILLQAAQNWAKRQGANSLLVSTQIGNLPAMNLYLTQGASILATAYWFYRK
ncbi:TDP-fucosamine acetyltransferase [Actinobacillus pleuropneumoniae]|uniref:TDP-fucosamine acetyltransferase n=1 Tax=Actinobacillus pleuropneumoniae TaxID=715 RepID=A0A3S4Y269_ACTPL|nr:dTDP-4-amino-4,6-dideoxy-D-galactose acyltransferase [Actinobacillus pleuropneumoniae]EFL77971.1 TDP-fucosamine acetyltransferase [Actinobacillus pleuropneumoniae serovar 2 str. 4226]EFM86996.1 Lipopolysaccharide biosynthesis protein RffC [Actinobacillus pleuropneumoniae serovar 2 str. S1536]EFM89207.1 Lipopolysaccharide biosynthesis protein RffC [Actinobacillus pleuropneumoniae serovar 4 str. M62]EFM95722.1 Lipopolysaccharide biosynthesis protein RffC [Actinobacillus pleuropneumoniae serova